MEKILVLQHQNEINKTQSAYNSYVDTCNTLLNSFNDLHLKKVTTAKEAQELIKNPSGYFIKAVRAEFPASNGLRDSILAQVLELGDSQPFTDAARALKSTQGTWTVSFKNGQFTPDDDVNNQIIEANSIYLQTEEELKAYEAISKAAELINSVGIDIREAHSFNRVFTTCPETYKLKPSLTRIWQNCQRSKR